MPLSQSQTEFLDRVAAFDKRVDEAFDRIRGHPLADRAFYLASELADFSLLWHIVGTARGLTSDKRADDAIRLSVVLGAESLLVNGLIKSFFRRTRPEWTAEIARPHHLRTPLSSSFPSGHASAAFVAAALLAEDDPKWPLYYAAALFVASSRTYVKIHHASDVVAGIATGMVLGRVARRLWKRH